MPSEISRGRLASGLECPFGANNRQRHFPNDRSFATVQANFWSSAGKLASSGGVHAAADRRNVRLGRSQ